jgi:hypothetical protein
MDPNAANYRAYGSCAYSPKPPKDDLDGIFPKDDNATTEPELAQPNSTLSIEQRVSTIWFVAPAFLVVDLVLYYLTRMVTAAIVLDPEPITKSVLLIGHIVLSLTDVVVGVAHVEYAHWAVTGQFIVSWDDLADWEPRP